MEADTNFAANNDKNPGKVFKCKYCCKPFSIKSNCNRHEKSCHKNLGSKTKFCCPNCESSYSRQDYLKVHLKSCTSRSQNPKTFQNSLLNSPSICEPPTETSNLLHVQTKNKTPCLVQDCNLEFFRKISLIEHLQSAHKSEISIKNPIVRDFSSFQEFQDWKEAEEESTFSYFSQKTSHEKNSTYCHYYCQHDGSQKLHFHKKTSRCNSKGRVKVGHYCIAKIKVTQNEDGSVHIQYFPTHSHKTKPQDFVHHPLNQNISQFIDKQIAEQVSPTKVFNKIQNIYVKNNTDDIKSNKMNFVTKKRIRERVRRQCNAKRLDNDDAKAVYLLAKDMIEREKSLLLYKPYSGNVVYGPQEIDNLPNSKELFMFGMQSERQLEIFNKYCGQILIIDETHGTNQYKYQLLTCMIVDENRRGWPVGHLITSKSDSATLQYFFRCLKNRLPIDAQINCVITDDDSALINSVNEGFSMHLRHILCQWHVWRNLKDNVRTKVDKDIGKEMTEELKVIINEKEEHVFIKLCEGFLQKYEDNPGANNFVKYFQQYYLDRKEKWAMCFRGFPHAEVNTTGHIESFHNKLKKVYLKRKVNKRLDDLINILKDMEWEDHCTRVRGAAVQFSSLPQHVAERHKKGIQINDNDVVEILPNTWEIQSGTNRDECYVVTQYSSFCTFDSCFHRCTNLQCQDLCSHLYSCTCLDRHSLCKHIHKIHSLQNREIFCKLVEDSDFYLLSNRTEMVNTKNENTPNEKLSEESADSRRRKTLVSRIGKHLTILNKFHKTAESTPLNHHMLAHVDSVLSNVVLTVGDNVVTSENKIDTLVEMKPAVQYHSQEKLKTQVSQLLPFKRPPKKRKQGETPSEVAERKIRVVSNLLKNLPVLQTKNAFHKSHQSMSSKSI